MRPKFGATIARSQWLRPAIEAIEDRLPWTEVVGQITPRNTGSTPPRHGFNEVAVVLRRPTSPSLGGEYCLYFCPLRIA